jgi:hypothetical protein
MVNFPSRVAQVRKLSNTFLFDFHDEIRHLPGSTKAREKVLKTALEYLDSLAREAEEDADLQIELADAYLRLGQAQCVVRSKHIVRLETLRSTVARLAHKFVVGRCDLISDPLMVVEGSAFGHSDLISITRYHPINGAITYKAYWPFTGFRK